MRIRKYKDKYGVQQESIVLAKEEQRTWYDSSIRMIMENTGFVMENIEYLPEFQVHWEDYHKKGYWKDYYQIRKKREEKLKPL